MRKENTVGIITTGATIGIFIVMTITLICQREFNRKQIQFNQRILHLSEVSAIPQVVAVLESLKDTDPSKHNVFYSLENVSNAAALNLRQGSAVNRSNVNPFEGKLDTLGVIGDVFPGQKKSVAARRPFSFRQGVGRPTLPSTWVR